MHATGTNRVLKGKVARDGFFAHSILSLIKNSRDRLNFMYFQQCLIKLKGQYFEKIECGIINMNKLQILYFDIFKFFSSKLKSGLCVASTLKNEKSLKIDLSPLILDQNQKNLKSSFYTLEWLEG
jgi:hypothetical protein